MMDNSISDIGRPYISCPGASHHKTNRAARAVLAAGQLVEELAQVTFEIYFKRKRAVAVALMPTTVEVS